jgi:hypothetical protein
LGRPADCRRRSWHRRRSRETEKVVKLYLDDERLAPAGWVQVRWPSEVIELLPNGGVTDISLDHDLGDDDRGTGYDVILWIEEAMATRGFSPSRTAVHSANSSASKKMELGIESIQRLATERTSRSE